MMSRKKILITALILSLAAASCSKKYSYYYRDKETKTRDCSQPASTSHKYKK